MKPVRFNRRAFLKSAMASSAAAASVAVPQTAPAQQNPPAVTPPSTPPGYAYLPIHDANRNKASWTSIGPSVVAMHARNIEKFRNAGVEK